MSLAVRLALLDTRLPLTTASESEEGIGAGDFDVDDDYGNAVPIKSAAQIPILTLVNHVGPNILFDASYEEEAVLTGRYLVGVAESGKIYAVQNIDVNEAREGIQGRQDRLGLTIEEMRRGTQEGVDVSMAMFKQLRAHIEEPVDLYEIL